MSSFIAKDHSLSVEQAMKEKKIEVDILPYGTYEGDGIKIKIRNLTNRSLKLKLDRGATFIPDSDDEQTLVNSTEQIFALEGNARKTLHFYGYCTELHDKGPDNASTFTLSSTGNTKLKSLLNYMDSLKIKDQDMIQHAIWCVTDSQTVAYVGNDDPKTSNALRNYLCSLTGQKNTWYKTDASIRQNQNHEFIITPKVIKGDLSFTATEKVELKGVIKDGEGNIIYSKPNTISMPPGNITFEFKLTIEGWKKGSYAVVYTNNGKEVINHKFEI